MSECVHWQPELLPCCIAAEMAISLPELCQDCDTQHARTPALHTQTCLDPAPSVSFEITQAFNLYLIIPAILMKVKGIWNKIYSESQFEWGSKFTKLSAPARCYKKASILHCNSVTDWLTELQVFCSQVTAPNHQCMVRMKSQDSTLIECSSACCFISDRPSLYLDSNDWKLSRKINEIWALIQIAT